MEGLTDKNVADEEIQLLEEEMLKRHLQIMVAEGTIIGLNPEDPSQIAWQHKVKSVCSVMRDGEAV